LTKSTPWMCSGLKGRCQGLRQGRVKVGWGSADRRRTATTLTRPWGLRTPAVHLSTKTKDRCGKLGRGGLARRRGGLLTVPYRICSENSRHDQPLSPLPSPQGLIVTHIFCWTLSVRAATPASLSPKGATCRSPGRRPGSGNHPFWSPQPCKGDMASRHAPPRSHSSAPGLHYALSGLAGLRGRPSPRQLAWSVVGLPFGAASAHPTDPLRRATCPAPGRGKRGRGVGLAAGRS